jgi:hypothetical protein
MVGGWPTLWKMMEFVSWDDDIPNWMENKSHVPNHQPEILSQHRRYT